MLIKLFGVPELVQNHELLRQAMRALTSAGYERAAIRIGFSPIPIRPHNEEGLLRILVTGADGEERAITFVIAKVCAAYYRTYMFRWHGYEDPALPGQPGKSRGRSL